MTIKVITGHSRKEIEKKLDKLEPTASPERLIMTATGSSMYEYKGFFIREWFKEGNVRYDSAVEIDD